MGSARTFAMTPSVSKHRYTVHTAPGSDRHTTLARAFHKTETIDVKDGDFLDVPRGTYLVVP